MTNDEREMMLSGADLLVDKADEFHKLYLKYQQILGKHKIQLPRSTQFIFWQLRHTIQVCRDEILNQQGEAPNSLPKHLVGNA